MNASIRRCIYCRSPVSNIADGEHIIPQAIGGDLTILEVCESRFVCHKCNNGVLSQLDRELCSRSPLAWAAARILDAFVWQSWDVDDLADSLLLEARPDLNASSMRQYPQIVFEADGPQLRGDWEDVKAVGVPQTKEQRCWVHKTANVLDKLPKRKQVKAKSLIHQIWMSETKADANKAFDAFLETYQAKYPKATEYLAKDREVLLVFYDFPAEHWRHLRTTNPIESTFATIRLRHRRTKGSGSRIASLTMMFKLGDAELCVL